MLDDIGVGNMWVGGWSIIFVWVCSIELCEFFLRESVVICVLWRGGGIVFIWDIIYFVVFFVFNFCLCWFEEVMIKN